MSSAWGRRGVPASAAAPGTLRRAPDLISRQRFAHRAQLRDQALLFRSIQCTQCVGLDMVAQRAQLRAQPVRAVGEIQPIGPAVGRLAAPLTTRLLHSMTSRPSEIGVISRMLGERYLAGTFATKQSCNQAHRARVRPSRRARSSTRCAMSRARSWIRLPSVPLRSVSVTSRKIVGSQTVSKLMTLVSQLINRPRCWQIHHHPRAASASP